MVTFIALNVHQAQLNIGLEWRIRSGKDELSGIDYQDDYAWYS